MNTAATSSPGRARRAYRVRHLRLGVVLAMAIAFRSDGFRLSGWLVDSVLMRLQDACCVSSILFAILIVAARAPRKRASSDGGDQLHPPIARLERASVLALRKKISSRPARRWERVGTGCFGGISCPNALPAILGQITLTMAVAVLGSGIELSRAGGATADRHLGTMLKSAQSYPQQAPCMYWRPDLHFPAGAGTEYLWRWFARPARSASTAAMTRSRSHHDGNNREFH